MLGEHYYFIVLEDKLVHNYELMIRVESVFNVPKWNDNEKVRAIEFWTRKGVKFDKTELRSLLGCRGNLLGNLTSLDMSHLMTTLSITVSENNDLKCVLDVNPAFQIITEWNRKWWDLEMKAFESFLLTGDDLEEDWKAFLSKHRKAGLTWVLTFGIGGNRLPPEEKY